MKNLIIFVSISLIILISNSCFSGTTNISTGVLANKLKILRWGPEETKIGVVQNKQPDGKMGIWLDVSSTEGIGEIQILFAGKTMPTTVEPKLITAGVPVNELSTAGDKKIEIQSLETGEILLVGTFKVIP